MLWCPSLKQSCIVQSVQLPSRIALIMRTSSSHTCCQHDHQILQMLTARPPGKAKMPGLGARLSLVFHAGSRAVASSIGPVHNMAATTNRLSVCAHDYLIRSCSPLACYLCNLATLPQISPDAAGNCGQYPMTPPADTLNLHTAAALSQAASTSGCVSTVSSVQRAMIAHFGCASGMEL